MVKRKIVSLLVIIALLPVISFGQENASLKPSPNGRTKKDDEKAAKAEAKIHEKSKKQMDKTIDKYHKKHYKKDFKYKAPNGGGDATKKEEKKM
jgi:hypothetical protein